MTMSKVKSRSHHDVAHLLPPTNVPTKYQLPTPYGFQDIAWTRFYRSRSLRQGPRSNQDHTITLHTYTPLSMSLPSINFLHLTVAKIYSLDKILWVKVTAARSKVKSRSHNDVAHLHSLTNVHTKYQLPSPYSFRDIAQSRFSNSRSLRQGQGQIKVTI